MSTVTVNFTLAVLAFSALVGCGGGGSSTALDSQPTPPVDAALNWDDGNWDEEEWQ